MKKILICIFAVLLLAGSAEAFVLYIFPYSSGQCVGKIGGYSYDYKTFLYPNTGYSSTYYIEEIPDNEALVSAILENWNCNRFPDGKKVDYVNDEIKGAVSDTTGDGEDSSKPIIKSGHMSYGDICPLFCIDASGNLIYLGSDPALQVYFTQ
jgi:hypothetical protein